MLEELACAEHDIGELASGRQGLLRITTECYTCYHWIPTVLDRFRERFPGVAVRIVPEATRQPFAALRKGAVDVAIVHSLPKDDDVRTVDLFADEQVVLVAPDHPWARRSHVEPDAFSGETLVVHFEFEESFLLERVLRPAGVRPDHVLEVQLTEAVLATVKAGIGVTVMARWAVAPSLERGDFAALSLTGEGVRRPWYAATLASTSDRPAVAAFLQSLGDDALGAAERAPRAGEG